MANYSFTDPGDDIPDGSTINNGNFSQLVPGTEILVGKTLVINGGNWVNVKVQPEWTINGGNWTQVSRCSHVSPFMVAYGLPECDEVCEHATLIDDGLTVDGVVVVDPVYEYIETRV